MIWTPEQVTNLVGVICLTIVLGIWIWKSW